jgi:hypothetical protein
MQPPFPRWFDPNQRCDYHCRMPPAWHLVGDFLLCLIGSWESPPSISLRVTRKPGCTGLVRDSRVRDWLWLWKVLTPLTHLTWGKLLRGFDVISKVLKVVLPMISLKKKIISSVRRSLSYWVTNLIALASIKQNKLFYLISWIYLTYKIIILIPDEKKIFFWYFLKYEPNSMQIKTFNFFSFFFFLFSFYHSIHTKKK